VMRWKKGVLVTDAPDVLYFEDTDGNGTAEIRRVVLTGFAFTNPQHTVNSPIYGLDNWIYLAHEGPATAIVFPKEFGDRGGNVRFPDRPDAPSFDPTPDNCSICRAVLSSVTALMPGATTSRSATRTISARKLFRPRISSATRICQ
jgi:hypothetical protein